MSQPCLDNFGGSAAWDSYCSDQDAILQLIKADDPGCGMCYHYTASEYSAEHGMCTYGIAKELELYFSGRLKHYPIVELVEAHGYVPCEYETFSLG